MGPIHPVWALAAIPLNFPLANFLDLHYVVCCYPLGHLVSEKQIAQEAMDVMAAPISTPRVKSSKGPNRVKRAHWPTKENLQKYKFV